MRSLESLGCVAVVLIAAAACGSPDDPVLGEAKVRRAPKTADIARGTDPAQPPGAGGGSAQANADEQLAAIVFGNLAYGAASEVADARDAGDAAAAITSPAPVAPTVSASAQHAAKGGPVDGSLDCRSCHKEFLAGSRIVNAAGKGLPNVEVRIVTSEGVEVGRAMTGSDGCWWMNRRPNGPQDLTQATHLVGIRDGKTRRLMRGLIVSGNCASQDCHGGTQGPVTL